MACVLVYLYGCSHNGRPVSRPDLYIAWGHGGTGRGAGDVTDKWTTMGSERAASLRSWNEAFDRVDLVSLDDVADLCSAASTTDDAHHAAVSKAAAREPCYEFKTTQTDWKTELRGTGTIAWDAEELESAAMSARLFEQALEADVTPEVTTKRTRSDDVVMEETLRKMGDMTLQHLRTLEESGAERERMLDTVKLFVLPTTAKAFTAVNGGRSAVAAYLDVGQTQKGKCRARNTWARYRGPMRKIRAYLRSAILADGRTWCKGTLVEYPQYIRSVAGWAYATTSTASAVESAVLALRLCLKYNDIRVEDDFMTKAVREVSKRERSKAAHRRAAITRDEVYMIMKQYRGANDGGVKRMIACVVGLAFQCLLRWADLALIHVQGIFWYPDGCVFALPRRKNAQHKPELVAFADTGKDGSLFKMFRAHCEQVAGRKMPREGRCTAADRFVFRDITKPAVTEKRPRVGYTWKHKRMDVLEMESNRPIGRSAYKKYLVRFREALEDCCGMTEAAIKEFGMHSMRVGGDTWLFQNNMPQDVRQRMGGWASAFSEKTYIRTLVAERLETCKHMAI